jgi:NAD(P)H-dependent FMN reductase
MEEKLKERGHTVYLIDPLELGLPLLDKMYKEISNPSPKLIQLRNQIVEADGYMPITPEYNHSTSAAMKNTLDYFLEEYYFKPSAIVSYSVGRFGGINAVQHLRLIFAELGAPSISSSFSISKVQDIFDDDGRLRNQLYEKRVGRFIEDFEWYIEAFKNQRLKGTPY